MKRQNSVIFSCFLVAAIGLPIWAQSNQPGDKLADQYIKLGNSFSANMTMSQVGGETRAKYAADAKKDKFQLKSVLARGVTNPDFNSEVISALRADYELRVGKDFLEHKERSSSEETVAQTGLLIAAQNAAIIEQNKQMIALLQKIAAKK